MDNADMLLTCDKMLWAISVNNICRFFFFSLTKVSHKSPVSSNAVYLCTYSVKYHINILQSYNSRDFRLWKCWQTFSTSQMALNWCVLHSAWKGIFLYCGVDFSAFLDCGYNFFASLPLTVNTINRKCNVAFPQIKSKWKRCD